MRAHVHDNVGFFCALLLLAPIVVKFLLRCSSRSMSATYHDPIARAQTHITINSHCWWNPCEIQHSSHYVLAYNRSRVPTCQILERSSGRTPHVVRDRSASELPSERKTLRGQNSAPKANQTLRFKLEEYCHLSETGKFNFLNSLRF